MRRVRIELRRGETAAARGEEPVVEMYLADEESIVGFTFYPPGVARPHSDVLTWRWKAYICTTEPSAEVADRAPNQLDNRLLTAAEVAERFGVTRDWVYQHAEDLGALRLGEGDRPRLRFELTMVRDAFRRAVDTDGPETSRGHSRPSAPPSSGLTPGGAPLLPLRPESRS